MTVITRFAPSPTGFLHIGSVRTAYYNWLYARHHQGKFLLRIEDTDQERSTQPAIDAIINGLKWLQLDWDDEIIFQFSRANRHQEVAHELVRQGKAYYCYSTPQELDNMRILARAEGRQPRYNGVWRDRDPAEAPIGIKPVIRLKAPTLGDTTLQDLVQGKICVQNIQLDDMVLLRADQTPTYMLAVVVDDHDMNITHVIRGDDHLTNTFRQIQIYRAMNWPLPYFSHIPLIHGPDGAKLSKRHGALGIEAYQEMGFLQEGLLNYLLKLGWGHGDDEIISRLQAIDWFDVKDVGQAASRFDTVKLISVNSHYMQTTSNQELLNLVKPFLEQKIGFPLNAFHENRLLKLMSGLKKRSRTLIELANHSIFLVQPRPLNFEEKAKNILTSEVCILLQLLIDKISILKSWKESDIEHELRTFTEIHNIKLGDIAQPLRAALTGQVISPGIFEIMLALGQEETLERIKDVITLKHNNNNIGKNDDEF